MDLLLRLMVLLLLLSTAPLAAQEATETRNGRFAALLNIDGAIGPATSDYFSRSLEQAGEQGAEFVILRMDTPGGLDSAMREIIKAILASPIPVVSYVYPRGARAASAGTYILYASHVAAMAPATNLGAATPVSLGPGTPGGGEPPPADEEAPPADGAEPTPRDEAPVAAPADPKARKVVNDAVAYIRSLAQLRDRNADWAEQAVRRGVSLEAEEAVKMNVVDLVAADIDGLMRALDGRTVSLDGAEYTFATEGLDIVRMEPDWRSRLLAVITDPNVAYLLLLVGIYGLIFEFANPGALVPGVIGSICLVLGLFALQVLPVNYAGLGLILLGIALMVGEAFAPSFGALGIGGVVAFVFGSIILIDTEAPGFGISIALIAAVAAFSVLLFMFLLASVLKARERPVVSGREQMIGSEALVLEDFTGEGMVRAHSELWRASSDVPLVRGQKVRVTGLDGLCLKVEPLGDAQQQGG